MDAKKVPNAVKENLEDVLNGVIEPLSKLKVEEGVSGKVTKNH